MKGKVVLRMRRCELWRIDVDRYEWRVRFGDVVVKKV